MKLGRLIIATIVSGVVGFGAVAQSSGLARLTDREDLLGWEAVGRLDLAGSGFCTGTLIASDLVLTAAHCVYHPQTSDPVRPTDLLFRAGLRDGTSIAERVVSQVAAHPRFNPKSSLNGENIRHDVALLRLAEPIVSTDADPFILHSGPAPGSAVSVVSYGRGRAEALSRQRSCKIVGSQDELMAFDCNVTFGSSGAPVFAHSGSRGRIISLISGGTVADGRQLALGMALPEVVDQLKRALRAAPVVRPNVTVRRLSVGENRSGTGAKFVKP